MSVFSVQITGNSSPIVSGSISKQVTWCKYYIFALLFNSDATSSTFPRPSAIMAGLFDNLLPLSHVLETSSCIFLSNTNVGRWHRYPEKGAQGGRTETQRATPRARRDLSHSNVDTHAVLCTSAPFLRGTTLTGDQVPRCYSAVIFFPQHPHCILRTS